MLSVKPIKIIRPLVASGIFALGIICGSQCAKNSISEEQREYYQAVRNYQKDSTKFQRAYDKYAQIESSYNIALQNYTQKKKEARVTGGIMLKDINQYTRARRKFRKAQENKPEIEALKLQMETSKKEVESKKENLEISKKCEEIYKANHEKLY
ncbi:MAG: hypothetical protein MJ231_03590 [bacterium]|nr:hypothetical protein [bacterium]